MVGSAKNFDHGHSGIYSIESKLKTVRGQLSEASKKISELDNNMIFLLFRPDLANPANPSSVSPIISAAYILDQSTLDTEMGEFLSIKRDLMLDEEELVAALRRSVSAEDFERINKESCWR